MTLQSSLYLLISLSLTPLTHSRYQPQNVHQYMKQNLPANVFGPDYSPAQKQLVLDTGCNPYRAESFNDYHDRRCLQYLKNISNWDLSSLKAPRENQPWGHFRLILKDGGKGLKAVIKPGMTDRKNNPHGEYSGYLLDRLLGGYYVTPVAVIDIPVKILMDAPAEYPTSQPALTAEFNKFLAETKQTKETGMITVSIQLRMNVAVDIATTNFQKAPYVNAANALAFTGGIQTKLNTLEKYVNGFHSDLRVFDYLCWNGDRDSGGNILAVQSCTPKCDKNLMQEHPGSPEMIIVDQTACFQNWNMRTNPIVSSPATFCRFRKDTLDTLRNIVQAGGLYHFMTIAMPEDFPSRLPRLSSIDKRVQDILNIADNCTKQFGFDNVVF